MRLDSVYVCYWSYADVLAQSQALPIVRALARAGYRMGLVTYEQPRVALDAAARAEEVRALQREGITWRPLRYHARPAVASTLWDATRGLLPLLRLRPRLYHSRSSVAAAPAWFAARVTGARFLYDADGPLSEEYVDAGVWRRGSWAHRLTSGCEALLLRRADRVAVLTERRREQVRVATRAAVDVVPCAVDTDLFRFDPRARSRLRQELGFDGNVFVYAGKWGGWYASEQMLDFVGVARQTDPGLRLLVLTQESPEPFVAGASRRGFEAILRVRSASRAEMPAYLSSADAGLSFVHPLPSKQAASPIKNGEYWACGLPVVTTPGIGDYSTWIADSGCGVVLGGLDDSSYRRAASALVRQIDDRHLRARCREAACRHAGLHEVVLPRYFEIYRELLGPPRAECRAEHASDTKHRESA